MSQPGIRDRDVMRPRWVGPVRGFAPFRSGHRSGPTACGLVLALLVGIPAVPAAETDPVVLRRTPAGGIQPQAAVDAAGTVHLVFFRGDNPAAGDVYYTRSRPGKSDGFDPPVRVNSQPGSAVALGTMRGAQIALGRGGRVHVIWNGSTAARPANPAGGAPLLYSRSGPGDAGFSPQRNVMQHTLALDGGGTVAADDAGRVFVAWHARPAGAPEGEVNRRLFLARSDDDGATFGPEVAVVSEPTGACPCCGTRALATSSGEVHVLFRAATGGTDRDMMLASSSDHGDHFEAHRIHPWRLNMCPMSSASLVPALGGVLAAWETQGQVFVARVDPAAGLSAPPTHPRGSGGNRKHPAVACNARGDYLVVWAEDTSFQHGGSLAWRVFDPVGKPTGAAGRVEGGIPAHSLPTVVAQPDGRFLIIH